MKLENSETLQCLINAFTGESLARNRYLIYAKTAKKEGYNQVADVFEETASNEYEHAKLFYKKIPNVFKNPTASYPFFFGSTYENLLSAADGEQEEWEKIYKNSSLIAKEEGFDEISALFANIAEIEKRHAHRYRKLAGELKSETLLKKEEVHQWICTKCGHTHIGKEAPCRCPVCEHPQEYFKLFNEIC